MAVRNLFAEQPIKISRLPSFRAEHFHYSGPYPWLDQPDASERIADKVRRGEISIEEAEQCRYWAANGYIVLEKLPPETAGEDDPLPGRFLNPHKKTGAFCRILKHPALLRWIRLLMEREPKPLQTIASHKGSQQGAHSDSIHMTTCPRRMRPAGMSRELWFAGAGVNVARKNGDGCSPGISR